MRTFSIAFSFFIYGCIAIATIWILVFSQILQAPVAREQINTTHLVIPKGSSYCGALKQMAADGWSIPLMTCYYSRFLGVDRTMQYGEIVLGSCCENVADLIRLLSEGIVQNYKIEFAQGATVKDILRAIAVEPNLQKRLHANNARSLANELQSNYKSLEGLLFPDTYHFGKGTWDADIVKNSLDQLSEIAGKLWSNRARGLVYRNVYEALILASIIEKEARYDDERAIISSVYLNRLERDMKLDADPTVIYGLLDSGLPFNGRLFYKDLQIDTAYNTYLHKGLPPTPISTVSEKSLEAALHPVNSNYLFFVADKSGRHIFAEDYQQHLKNVARVRKQ